MPDLLGDRLKRQEVLKLLENLRATMGQSFMTDEKLREEYDHAKDWYENLLKENDRAAMTIFVHGVNRTNPTDRVLLPAVFAGWPVPAERGGVSAAVLSIAQKFIVEFPECMPIMVTEISDNGQDLLVDVCTMDQRRHSSLRTMKFDEAGKFVEFENETETLYEPGKLQDPKENMNRLILSFYIAYFRLTKTVS